MSDMKEKYQRQSNAVIKGLSLGNNDINLINQYTMEPLKAEDVFVFQLAISNNRIDRDYEKISKASLENMIELFKGRTMIKDHAWKSDNQVARIYDVEIKTTNEVLEDGENYCELIAKVYMLNSEANQHLISEIKAGIKKECSIGFGISGAICSICGVDNAKTACQHWWGKEYEGNLCFFTLIVKDAYEVSFVAVPANKDAGTTKDYGQNKTQDENIPNGDAGKQLISQLSLELKIAEAELKAQDSAFSFEKEGENE